MPVKWPIKRPRGAMLPNPQPSPLQGEGLGGGGSVNHIFRTFAKVSRNAIPTHNDTTLRSVKILIISRNIVCERLGESPNYIRT